MAKLIDFIAQTRGTEMALADEYGETTWSELNERTNRLIASLRATGLRSGDTIAILSGNRREYYELMLAATHAGWRYVPVNWHWVGEEIAYVLDNSDARALVVGPRYLEVARDALKAAQQTHLLISRAIAEPAPEGFVAYEELLGRGSEAEPDEQGLGGPMFYTSGTTGRPKGVVNTAAAMGGPVEFMQLLGKGLRDSLQIPEAGRTLLEGPIYHSAQWAFSFFPLMAGNAVVMRHKFESAETLELIDRYRITNIHLVPTQFVRLLRQEESERAAFDGSSLAVVWHGAAPCPPAVKRQMLEWWGPVVWEYYGSTEGAIISVISPQEWLERPRSVGKPLPQIEVFVIRDDGSPADVGEEGQLYFRNRLGSDFEYHKDPAKTEAAHLEPGVFTVGDVGSLDADGYLSMSDRKIDMIISGGVNIYPAEIEGVLVQHPAVADAAVFGIPNDEYGEEVKAAVSVREGYEGGPALAEELVAHCRVHLASYKVPRSVDFESALPRHPTGKLYKRLLRDPYWEDAGRSI